MQIDVDGVPARQNEHIDHAMEMLVQNFPHLTPRMIEIGTYAGGFTMLLTRYYKGPIHSFDIDETPRLPYKKHLHGLARFTVCDVFEGPWIKEIWFLIGGTGPCLVFCDGGNKPLEFKIFAPMLKSGDIILAHDLGTEIHEKDVEDLCRRHGLDPFLQEAFTPAKWLIRRKR